MGLAYKRAHEKTNRNNMWYKVTNKTLYTVKIIFDNLSWKTALRREIRLIHLLGRKDLKTGSLVNMTHGGEGSYKRIVTAQTREKIKNYQLGRPKSPETIEKSRISAIKRGISPENRAKITISRLRNGWDNYKHKPVICTKTGTSFLSIKDAAPYSGWSKSHLASMLRGEKPNITTLQYI